MPLWSLFDLLWSIHSDQSVYQSFFFYKELPLYNDPKQKHTHSERDVVTSKGCHRGGVRWSVFMNTSAVVTFDNEGLWSVISHLNPLLCRHLKKSRGFSFAYNCGCFFFFHWGIHLLPAPESFPNSSHMPSIWPFPLPNYPPLTSNVLSGQLESYW